MRKKIKNIIDTFSNYDTDTKMFIILLITSATTVLMLTAYFFQKYIALIFTLAVVVVVFAWDSICSAYQHLKHPQGTCESCCIGCDAMYPFVLTTVYETLKTISPVLHFSIPPTDRQIQSLCPPKADGLPLKAPMTSSTASTRPLRIHFMPTATPTAVLVSVVCM